MKILAVSDEALAEKLAAFRREDTAKTLAADREIQEAYNC